MAVSHHFSCVICVNAKATMQTFPCGHRVVCRKCFVKTIQDGNYRMHHPGTVISSHQSHSGYGRHLTWPAKSLRNELTRKFVDQLQPQVAVSQRLLPLRCVVCRAKILRLRQSRDGPFPSSVSQYSMASYGSGSTQHHIIPASHSLYSFTSGSSGFSGISNISSASSESGESFERTLLRTTKGYRQVGHPQVIKKVKVTSKSGARSKESFNGKPQQIRIDSYEVLPVHISAASRTPRVLLRENKVAPQELTSRLPTIKEYAEFITEREMEREKSSSTRIRCAQKLVHQLEHNNNKNINSNNNNNNSIHNNKSNNSNSNHTLNNKKVVNPHFPNSKGTMGATPSVTRKGSSNSVFSSRASNPIKQNLKFSAGPFGSRIPNGKSPGEGSCSGKMGLVSNLGMVGTSGSRNGAERVVGKSLSGKTSSTKSVAPKNTTKGRGVKREPSSSSSSFSSSSSSSTKTTTARSITPSPSVSSNLSVKSTGSSRSSSSYRSVSSSTRSSTSSFSTSSTITVKSCRALIPTFRKDSSEGSSKGGGRRNEAEQKSIKEEIFDRKCNIAGPKQESKTKTLKKKVDGKEYHRLH